MDPLMNGDVFGQYLAVDYHAGHLVLRIDLQVLGLSGRTSKFAPASVKVT